MRTFRFFGGSAFPFGPRIVSVDVANLTTQMPPLSVAAAGAPFQWCPQRKRLHGRLARARAVERQGRDQVSAPLGQNKTDACILHAVRYLQSEMVTHDSRITFDEHLHEGRPLRQ